MQSVPIHLLSPGRVRRTLTGLWLAVAFSFVVATAQAQVVTIARAPGQSNVTQENGGSVTFRISCAPAATDDLVVELYTLNNPGNADPYTGTLLAALGLQIGSDYAVAGSDYTSLPAGTTRTIANGTSFTDFTVTILNDTADPAPEFNKDVFVYVRRVVSGTGSIGATRTASVTILDDDQPGGALDRAWNLDNNFNTVPPNNPLPGANDTVNAVAIDPNNVPNDAPRTIIGGDFTGYNADPINRIARINFDGSMDTTFNPGLGANNFVSAIAVYTNNASAFDGTIIVGGGFTSFDGTSRNGIARLTATGALDLTFDPGAGFNGPVRSLVIQPDDKIVVGGQFTLFNGVSRTNIARLNTDGTLDTTFDPGMGANGVVYAVALQGNPPPVPIPTVNSSNLPFTNVITLGATAGTLTLTANMFQVPNTLRVYYGDRINDPANTVLMLNTNYGQNQNLTFNIPFGPTVPGVNGTNGGPFNTVSITIDEGQVTSTPWTFNGSITTVAAGPEIVIGGDFTMAGGVARNRIALLRQDGTLDTGFDPGTGADATVYALAVQTDGKVVLGGAFSSVNVNSRNGIARVNTDGSVDSSFNPGTGANGRISAIALDASSRPVIVGAFTMFNGTARTNVARLLTTGVLDTTFMDLAYNQFAGPLSGTPSTTLTPVNVTPASFLNAVAIQSDGNVVIGGFFARVGAPYSYIVGTSPASAFGGFDLLPTSLGDATAIYSDSGGLPQTFGGSAKLRWRQTKSRNNVARLIGRSSPGSGNMEFLSSSYLVNEGAGTAFLKLQRINGSTGPASADYTTANLTALTPTHYTGEFGTVSWLTTWNGVNGTRQLRDAESGILANNNNTTLQIAIGNDAAPGPDRTLNVLLTNIPPQTITLGGGVTVALSPALGSQNSAILTIVDNDFIAGTLSFSSTNYSVLENAGTATITVTRTGGSVGVVSVRYATSVPGANFATVGSDYTGVTNTLTFLTGETNKTFTVPILNDATVEQDERVTLTLSNPTGGATVAVPPNNPATLTIIDDDFPPGSLGLTSAAYAVNENASYVDVVVQRTGGAVGASAVVFSTSDGTATTALGHYVATNTVLTWGNGDASSRTIRIPIINNQDVNTTGSGLVFNVSLANFTNSATGSFINSPVTINDDDSFGTVQFVSSNYSVTENGGIATITVVRTGSGGTVTVPFSATDGTAVDGTHYTNPGSVPLTMGPGVTSATVHITILDDGVQDLVNPDRTVNLILGAAFGDGLVNLGVPAPATLTIKDDETYNIPAGSLDALFTPGNGPNGVVQTVDRQNDGKLLIGGEFTEYNNVARNRIARLNPNGTLDTAFLSTQTGADGTVSKILVQPNGQILVAGAFTTINNTNLQYLVRLNIDGSVDSAFYPGTGPDNPVSSLALQSDGKIIVVGGFATFDGSPANFIVRLDTNGVVDTTFSTGTGADGSILAVAIQPDGKILVGGEFTTINGATNANRIARLNTDGSVDATFFAGVGPNGANDSVLSVVQQSDGKIVLGGLFTTVNGVANLRYARLLNNGTQDGELDLGFTSGDANDVVNAIAIQPDGKIVLVGDFTTCSGVTRNRITRLKPDGTVDPTINFGSGANNVINAALIQPADGMIVIGGGFTSYDSTPINYLARLNGGSLGGQGRLEFTAANYFADENGGSVVVTVRRIGGTQGTVTANYQTGDLTATNGVHYGGFASGTDFLTFPNGETLRTFTITITNDNVVNLDRTVNLALFNFTNAVPALDATLAGNQTNAVLTIINDDGVLGFAAATFSVNENAVGGFATITVTRSGGTTAPASVRYASSDGTATASGVNPDYTAVSGTLNFAAGQSIATFIIPIVQDGLVEGDETVKLTLSNLTGAVTPGTLNATLSIVDDDFAPGDLEFSSATYGVDEAGTNAVITVIRTSGSLGRVSVNYTTGNGTAIAGTDYTTASGNLSFANGQTSRTFTVPILINPASTNNTTVNLSLNTPTGGASLGGQSASVLTITNNDLIFGNFVFSAPTFSENENAGVATITVSRIGGSVGAVSVSYAITNGTAIAGLDYTNSSNPYVGTLSWLGTDATDKTFNIDLVNNGLVDGDRTINLRLLNPTGRASLGALNTATLTILDDEVAPGIFNFAVSAFTVSEDGTNAVIAITRTFGKTDTMGPVSVHFFTTPGTAVSPGDYTHTDLVLNFVDNQTSTNVLIPIIDNQVVAGNKIVNLTLDTALGGSSLGAVSIATLTIIDDDPPAGSFDDTFTPGAGANAPIHALGRQSGGNLVIGGDFTTYDGLNRTNVALLLASGALDATFDAGRVTLGGAVGSVRAIGVQSDDKVVMGGLFDTVNAISRNYIARLNTNGVVDLTFNPGTGANNPVYALAVQNNGRIVAGGAFTAFNTATRNFVVRLLADGSVDSSFAPPLGPDSIVRAVAVDSIGRVLIGGDFQFVDGVSRSHVARLLANGSLDTTFNPGANLDGSVFSIALQPDGKLVIGGLFQNYGAASRNYIARLNDDGSLDASFDPAAGASDYVNSVVLQGDGKVLLAGGFTSFNGLSRNGIARLTTLGAVDPSINFGSGANNDVDALLVQPNGSIVLAGAFTLFDGLTNNYLARVNGGTNLGAGVFGYSASAYSVNENGGTITITVTRIGGTSNTVTLDFATLLSGSAVAGTHYTATNNTLTFLEGETAQTFAIRILNDVPAATNVNRTIDLGLVLNPLSQPGNPSLGQTTATVTIIDNESVIGFSAATFNVVENNGPATITVTRVGGTNDAVTVRFATTDGTAVSPGRYTGVTNILNFAPGQTSSNISITIPDNLVVNGDETVILSLSNYTGSALRGLTNATLNIIDNEFGPGQFSFSASTYSVNETTGGTNATITVRRTSGQQGAVTVQYATSNGTGVSGTHYTSTSGTLSWANGDSSPKTFTVPILNNATVSGTRTVNLTLSNPSAPATLGSPSTAVLTIFDNDTGFQFSQATYSVLENAGFATINVYRTDALAGTVTVKYTSSGGTAVSGTDFTAATGTLTFGPGVTNVAFTVPILDNPVGYINTTVNLALSLPTGGATVSATKGTAVLTIVDVAAGAVDLSFGATLGANGPIYSVAFMTNGQVVLGGDFTAVNSVPINRVARLNSNGTTDLGFNPGFGANNTVYAVAVQTNNSAVIIGGSFTTVGGFNQGRIARLTSTGATDFSFNFGGAGADSTVYAVGIDPNGFILIGGSFTNVNGTGRGGIARLNTFGAVDGTFNPSTGANGTVRALDIDGFNRIVIAGDFTSVNGTSRTRIARLNADGTLDATFNPGLGADATIYSVKVTTSGKILVAGAFTTFNGITKYGITQLTSTGAIDSSFNAGIGANGVITALGIDTNGRILVTGDFTTINGSSRVRFARLNSDGSLDGNFDPGLGANAIVNAVTVLRQPTPPTINLGVGAGGQGTQIDVFDTGSTAGTITINYDMLMVADDMRVYYGDIVNDPANAVLLFDTGAVSFTGTFSVVYGPGASTIISVAMNELVPIPFTAWSYTITIVPDATPGLVPDRIVIGGDFTSVGGTPRDRFAEINNDGSLNTTYGMGASLPVVLALGINSNPGLPTLFGKTVAGGSFSVINGVNANNIVRLNLDGSVDLNFNPGTGANGQVNALAVQSDGKVIIGGYFTTVNGTARNYIARLNSNGSLDATFNPGIGANNPIFSVALQPDGKILVGGLFTSYNTTPRNFLARLNSDGTVDATFNPSQGPSDVVRAIAVQGTNIVIGGDFSSYDVQPRSHLARLTSTGALDPDLSFDPLAGVDNSISTIKVDASGNIVVGGSFTLAQDSVNLNNWNGIARFTSTGTLDIFFNPGLGFNDYVSSIAIEPGVGGKLVVAGAFTLFDGIAENRIVRLNDDGSLDTTINFGSGANNYISAAQLQADGKIVIGGAFTSVDSVPRTAIARLMGGGNTSGSGVFEFSASNFTVSENGVAATITVNRRGVLSGPVFVDFSTSDGTAIAYPGVGPTVGFNYTNTSLTLNFENGQTSTNFTIGIIDDGATNVNRTVNLTLSNPSPGADLGNIITSTLTIVDDDSVLNFSALSYSVVENGVQAQITVNRLGGLANAVSVQYATSDGTARVYPGAGPVTGFDYTNSFGTLTWLAGDSSPKTFKVGIIDNVTTNGNRSLNLSLFNAVNVTAGQGMTLSGTTNATLTIVDNEFGPGVLGFATNAFFVAEGNNPTITTYTFPVMRTSGNTGPVRVNYTTANGTALAGVDYVATSGQLSFANGETVKNISVQVIGDTIVEGNETFSLVLSVPTGGSTLGLSSATVNITDDDGVIQFSSATYSVSEAGPAATITVTKTPVTSGTIRVNFATSNGTATAGTDYTATNGTLIFLVNETSKTFTVPITEDLLTEGNETVNLRLSNLIGLGFFGPTTNAVLTITDNDTGLQFSSATYSVAESGGTATITVQRTGNTNNSVSVTYSTSNGSATSGADYTAQNGTLTFAAGVTSQTFTIPITDDTLVEGNETVNLRLTLPTNGALLNTPNTAVLTIVDNDMSFEFTAANYTVTENGGNASITVRRNGVTTTAESVTASTSDGTAVAGSDYTARNVVLNFGVGVTTQTFTIPITNDALPEGDETVNLALSNPSGIATLGATNTAVLTIQDNDIVVQFTAATFSFSEGSSNALISVQRLGSTNNASTVSFTTAAGTATAGVDYSNVTATITFAAGVTNVTVAIPLREDLALEPDETVSLTLSNPSAGVTLGQAVAVLRIVDNDRIGSLDSAFDPGAGTDGIVNAVAVQPDGKVLIGGDFTTVNGTNRFGIARLNANGTLDLSFDTGTGVNGPIYAVAVDSQGNVIIGGIFTAVNGLPYANICRLLPDGSVDSLNFADPGINVNGAVTAIVVDGNDDILVAGDFTDIGGIGRNRVARISGTGGSLDLSFDPGTGANAMVNALTFDGSGNLLVGGFFNTFAGFSRGGVARLVIDGNSDGTLDLSFDPAISAGSVVYSLAVQPTDGYVVLGGDFNTVNGVGRTNVARLIVDGLNDGLVDLAFDPGAGVNSIVRSLAIDLNGHVLIGGDFTMVNNTNRNGIARLGTDGSLDPDLAVSTNGSFDPGIGAGGPVYAVVAQPDGMALVGGDFATMDGVSRGGIARLNGNQGVLQFSVATYSVNEDTLGGAVVTVTRAGGSSGTIMVDFLTADGAATTNAPNADYTRTAGTLVIPPGVTSTNIIIPLNADTTVETNEAFTITLSNPTGASTLGSPTTATVTIVNDDVNFNFSAATYSVLESGVIVEVIVTRGGDLGATAFVDLTTAGGTAISTLGPNQDYEDATQTLVFVPTQVSQSVFILINQDTAAEGDETVNLTLSAATNPTGGASLVTPSTSVLTIVDDDVEFNFSTVAYQVNEGGTNAIVTVTRRGDTNAAASVFIATSDLSPVAGAATAGSDYTAVARTLSFASGQVSSNVLVAITQDTLAEGNEVLNLALSGEATSNVLGFASAGQRTATLTILDDDVGFSFSAATFSVNENASPAVVTIVRTGDASQPASVDFSTSNGSATAGLDYAARINVRVDFAALQTSRTLNITIVNDSVFEGDETVNLTLSGGINPTGSVNLGPPAVLTIVDNDVGFGFASATFSASEGAGSATITVIRSGDTNAPVSVKFATSDGLATLAGSDYSSTNGTLNFAATEVSKTFTVPMNNDSLVEGDEFLNLTLSSATNPTGSSSFGQRTATLSILDNDVGFSFSVTGFTANENTSSATVTVVRTGDTNSLASVTFATTNGTATSGLDYIGQTNTLSFLPTEVTQNISIPLLPDSFAEGNETVLLGLATPATADVTGSASLGSIPAATLTIIDDDFVTIVTDSYVLTAESFSPANNGIDQNELVTVGFALRNDGNVPTDNLTAQLLATGGVTSPTPSTAVSYGVLLPSGPPKTNAFTFTATAAQVINATFQLQDGTTNLGTVTFSIQMGSLANFTNRTRLNVPGSLTIPSMGPASLYPAPIVVSNVNGVVNKVMVTLNQLTHPFPDDINVLLVSPTGQKVLAMANAGGNFGVANVTLTLDDAAATPLPDAGQIIAGGYRPANYLPTNVFPAPAPAGPYATTLSACNGFDPNGTWSLYVFDDTSGDNGLLQTGWTLTLYTVNPTVDLAVTVTDSPDPLTLGNRVTYMTTITNKGPFTATGVMLTNTLPAGATFNSASSQQGTCTFAGGKVVCNVGSLTNGASVTVTIVVTPTIPGVNNSSAVVAASEIELNPADNSVATTTQVNGAALSSAPSKEMFSLTLLGQNSKVYVIEASSDLTVWTPVSTNTVVNGIVIFTDQDATNHPRRFYRAIER